MAMSPFIWGAQGQQLTPDQVERLRANATLSSRRGSDASPVGHWSQGLARLIDAYGGYKGNMRADGQETAGLASADAAVQGNPVLSALMGGEQMQAPVAQPGMGAPVAPVGGGEDVTLSLIKGFEGFRETPYWDVNALRTGYGSDTITTPDGRVVPVTDGVSVTREDADRDLSRRVKTEFEPRAQQAAGAAWDSLQPEQRAALTSLAYNYGSVPSPVVNALQSGGDVAGSILSLSSHNDGINADRRQREADLFSGMSGGSAPGVAGNTPQAPSGVVAALASASSNPWVAQKYGPVINALMQQEMGRQDASYQQQLAQSDPMYQAQLQGAQIANQQAMQPQAVDPWANVQEINGQLVTMTPDGPQLLGDFRTPEAGPPRPMTVDERLQWGIPDTDTTPYAMTPDGPKAIGGGGVTVNNNIPGQDKFDEAFASGDAATMATISDAGLQAQRNIGRIDQLDQALKNSPSGAEAVFKQALGERGIKTDGLDAIQSAQALINSLVPEQRQPGSGPMSDSDLALFKQSLPRLVNTAEGNNQIIAAMRGIAQYDAMGAEIVQKVRSGEMTRAEGMSALQSRPNPLETFKGQAGDAMATVPSAEPAADAPARITDKAQYDALPSGAQFIAPDGSTRRKP